MSLILTRSKPKGLEVKTHGFSSFRNKLLLRGGKQEGETDCEIPFAEFLDVVEYVLTNTDIYPNDPRLKFLKRISRLKPIAGWNINQDKNCKRLDFPEEEEFGKKKKSKSHS